MKRILGLLIAAFAIGLPQLAIAQTTVDNPGPFTVTFDAPSDPMLQAQIKIGNQTTNLTQAATIGGSVGTAVDAAGNVTIAQGDINFPASNQCSAAGNLLVTVQPLSDGTGSLSFSGDSTTNITIQVHLEGAPATTDPPCSAGPDLGTACNIGPISLSLTTGTSGSFTGVAYNQTDGTETLVENVFTAPAFAAGDCNGAGGLLNLFIGLPSASGNNFVKNLHGTFNPVFTGT